MCSRIVGVSIRDISRWLLRVVLTVGAVAAGAAVLGVDPATASPPSSTPPADCGAPFNPYAYTRAAVEACGKATFPQTATTSLPGGGETHSYVVAGLSTGVNVPPAGFDPVTATDAQLDEYGFPPRPSDITGLAQWDSEFSNYAGSVPVPSFLTETKMSNFTGTNPTQWAGYRANGPNGTFTHAETTYWEPAQTYTTSCSVRAVSFWAGISGGGYIAQDGTYMGNAFSNTSSHQGWTEIFPTQDSIPAPIYATPNARFDASVEWLSSVSGYRFFLYNYSTNKSWSVDVSAPTGADVRSYAEATAEDPGYDDGTHPDLANVATPTNPLKFQWSKANGAGFDTYYPSQLNSYYVQDSSGGNMMDASSIGSVGYFEDVVHHCAFY